jgi:hypothetical protein
MGHSTQLLANDNKIVWHLFTNCNLVHKKNLKQNIYAQKIKGETGNP